MQVLVCIDIKIIYNSFVYMGKNKLRYLKMLINSEDIREIYCDFAVYYDVKAPFDYIGGN